MLFLALSGSYLWYYLQNRVKSFRFKFKIQVSSEVAKQFSNLLPRLLVFIVLYFKRGGGTIKSGSATIIRVTGTITPPSMGNCTRVGGGQRDLPGKSVHLCCK